MSTDVCLDSKAKSHPLLCRVSYNVGLQKTSCVYGRRARSDVQRWSRRPFYVLESVIKLQSVVPGELMINVLLVGLSVLAADSLGPGDHQRSIQVDGRSRSYRVHVPQKYQANRPAPVVLAFHGAAMNSAMMVPFCGMNRKSDEAGFIAVYPDGTGWGLFQTFNAGGLHGKMAAGKADDVKFVAALLDDLQRVLRIDDQRVYATGISNGGMMCYRLAAELSQRIAAIAPVSGTMAIDNARPKRAVPILHFHGTADRIVPVDGPDKSTPGFLTFMSVDETIRTWVRLNGCRQVPVVQKLQDKANDGTTVTKTTYRVEPTDENPPRENAPRNARGVAQVILVEIHGGGHTWPGVQPPLKLIGKSTRDISANDMMWDFFQRHQLP